jgi:hypothetical protein
MSIQKIEAKPAEDRYTPVFAMDVEDVYAIANTLRDSCGCLECQGRANALLSGLTESLKAAGLR